MITPIENAEDLAKQKGIELQHENRYLIEFGIRAKIV